MPNVAVFFFVLVAIAVVVGIIYSFYAAQQRRNELSAWAQLRGLRFRSDQVSGMDAAYPAFDCLNEGRARYGYNRMDGEWSGRRFLGFDYHYRTGSGKNTHDYTFSAIILESDVPLKPLFIRREGLGDRMATFLGFEDINFESAEFSREFYVKSPDRKWAYDVLHQRAMEFLLAMPRFTIQFDEQRVMVYRDSTFATGDFENAAKVAQGLLDGLPSYVQQPQAAGT